MLHRRVVRWSTQGTTRVRHMRWATRPRLIFRAPRSLPFAVFLQPLLCVLATLAEGVDSVHVGKLSQPAFAICVIVAIVEAPTDGQSTKGPTVASLPVRLAFITALLSVCSP